MVVVRLFRVEPFRPEQVGPGLPELPCSPHPVTPYLSALNPVEPAPLYWEKLFGVGSDENFGIGPTASQFLNVFLFQPLWPLFIKVSTLNMGR